MPGWLITTLIAWPFVSLAFAIGVARGIRFGHIRVEQGEEEGS